jgi:hypothetical protein
VEGWRRRGQPIDCGRSNASAGTNDLAIVGVTGGGGLRNLGTATITDSTFEHNQSREGNGNMGGSGGATGTAVGGGISNTSFAMLPNALIARNLTMLIA